MEPAGSRGGSGCLGIRHGRQRSGELHVGAPSRARGAPRGRARRCARRRAPRAPSPTAVSIRSTIASMSEAITGRLWAALRSAARSFVRSKRWRSPSRLITCSGSGSRRSKVVNRWPHREHSRRRRTLPPSGARRLSSTRVGDWQPGHTISKHSTSDGGSPSARRTLDVACCVRSVRCAPRSVRDSLGSRLDDQAGARKGAGRRRPRGGLGADGRRRGRGLGADGGCRGGGLGARRRREDRRRRVHRPPEAAPSRRLARVGLLRLPGRRRRAGGRRADPAGDRRGRDLRRLAVGAAGGERPLSPDQLAPPGDPPLDAAARPLDDLPADRRHRDAVRRAGPRRDPGERAPDRRLGGSRGGDRRRAGLGRGPEVGHGARLRRGRLDRRPRLPRDRRQRGSWARAP